MPRYDQNLPATRGQGRGLARYDQGDYLTPFSSLFSMSPFQMMRRMQEDMDRIFGPWFGSKVGMTPSSFEGMQRFQPNVDVSEDDKEYHIEVDLPGVKPEDVDVQIHDNHLILRSTMRQESGQWPQTAGQQATGQQAQPTQPSTGASGQQTTQQQQEEQQRQYHWRERRFGYFERVFPLPQNVDQQDIRCDFRDGVLALHLPKTGEIEAPQGRRIPINAAAASTATGAAGEPSMSPGQSFSAGPTVTQGSAGESEKNPAPESQGAGATGSNQG